MPSRELFPVVAFVAYLLFALLCNLLMLILTLLVMFAGPIGWLVGWVAMVRRLQREHPDHPLMQGSWNERLGEGHPGILGIYFKTYGLDDNVVLATVGMVATIAGFYFVRPITGISHYLLKSFGLELY